MSANETDPLPVVSQRASELVDQFDRAAQNHGYEREEGFEGSPEEAATEWKQAKRELLNFIAELERLKTTAR